MLSRLYFRPSTYKTLPMEAREGIPILPIPVIFAFPHWSLAPLSSSHQLPWSSTLGRRQPYTWSCYEHPLFRYQPKHWPFPTKDIYNRNYLRFWYQNLFGSNNISTLDIFFFLWMPLKFEFPNLPQKSHLSNSDYDLEDGTHVSKARLDLSCGCLWDFKSIIKVF